jgi:hypothetical protein
MAVAVASIAMMVINLVVATSGESTRRFAVEAAARAADGVRESLRAELIADPLAPYSRVLEGELPRVCSTGASTSVVNPGSAWPTVCGTVWTYQPGSQTVGARLTMPSPADPAMTVAVAARVGDISSGYKDRYFIGGRSRPVLYSGTNLNLNELRDASTTASVDGVAYAAGTLSTQGSNVDTANALLATESSFTTAPSGTTAATINGKRFASNDPSPGTETAPVVHDIRTLFPSVLPSSGIRAAATALEQIACPGVEARNVTVASATYTTHLCLHAGASLVNISGSAVTAPSAAAYLLLPNRSSSGTVDVYVRNTAFDIPGLPCNEADIENEIPACDLSELSTSAIATGSHPGALSAWEVLGTFHLPSSGIIATDADTHLGLCGSSFPSGSCQSWTTGSSGVVIDKSVTVVVGTASTARDLYLAGPVTAGTGRLGAIVTGSVVVPYWARPTGGDVRVELSLSIVGGGGAAIRTIPTSAPNLPGNTGGTFTISGAIGATSLAASASGPVFSGYALQAGLSPDRSPPLFALPVLNFIRDTTARLTPAELASFF